MKRRRERSSKAWYRNHLPIWPALLLLFGVVWSTYFVPIAEQL
jgi:hypothetical protein